MTAKVAKRRIFSWLAEAVEPDSAAIARDDDASFGILHSHFHEAWSPRLGAWLGAWLGVGAAPRYASTATFETFPFSEGLTPNIPASDDARRAPPDPR